MSGKKRKVKYVWVVAYIDNAHIDRTEEYLRRFEEYNKVTAFIPTVKILKKTFKKKNEFENVPLLFNYGFFKVPRHNLRNPEFFNVMRDRLPVIYQWVKDTAGTVVLKPKLRFKPTEDEEKDTRPLQYIQLAIASQKEINRLEEEAKKTTIYDHKDLKNIQPGSHIILKGYPWEDMEARVISIDKKKEEVRVELIIESFTKEVTVSFHNVYYSIYRGDHKVEPIREKSIEDMKYKGSKIADKTSIDIEI